MNKKSFQEYYPKDLSHCYGCGTQNDKGLQLKSYWEGDVGVARFTPNEYHIAVPGYVYGGLIASLIDCHGTGTASAAAYRYFNREIGSEPILRYVTAALHVDYLKPTPMGHELILKGHVKEINERKVIVDEEVFVQGQLCAKGQVVAVKIPKELFK